jgi:hypothetical protein
VAGQLTELREDGSLPAMSDRVPLSRWTKHPAFYVFGIVFLLRDVILAGLALGGIAAGSLAHQNTLSVVAVGLAALALAGVVASVTMQSRAGGLHVGHGGGRRVHAPAPPVDPPPRDATAEQPPAQAVTDPVSSARRLCVEMRDAQQRGAWDDEAWAYRRRVEAWTERTAGELARSGRQDLANALTEVQAPPRPPFERLLEGYSASYQRLVGLLEARIELLENSRG